MTDAKKKVLVFGWYGKGNIGDEAFKPAITMLWDQEFVFTDVMPPVEELSQYKSLILGGGSFTDQPIPCKGVYNYRKMPIPLAYIGVGIGDFIHPHHLEFMDQAKIIVTRDSESYHLACDAGFSTINAGADLAVVLGHMSNWFPKAAAEKTHIGVALSDSMTPRQRSPIWQYDAHRWFMRECAKSLDDLARHCPLYFMNFCVNDRETDERPTFELTGKMDRYNYKFSRMGADTKSVLKNISSSHFLITQRYHGAIFAMMLDVPCILISSHDKMKSLANAAGLMTVPYYGFTDVLLNDAVREIQGWSSDKAKLYIEKGRKTWGDLSVTVAERLGW